MFMVGVLRVPSVARRPGTSVRDARMFKRCGGASMLLRQGAAQRVIEQRCGLRACPTCAPRSARSWVDSMRTALAQTPGQAVELWTVAPGWRLLVDDLGQFCKLRARAWVRALRDLIMGLARSGSISGYALRFEATQGQPDEEAPQVPCVCTRRRVSYQIQSRIKYRATKYSRRPCYMSTDGRDFRARVVPGCLRCGHTGLVRCPHLHAHVLVSRPQRLKWGALAEGVMPVWLSRNGRTQRPAPLRDHFAGLAAGRGLDFRPVRSAVSYVAKYAAKAGGRLQAWYLTLCGVARQFDLGGSWRGAGVFKSSTGLPTEVRVIRAGEEEQDVGQVVGAARSVSLGPSGQSAPRRQPGGTVVWLSGGGRRERVTRIGIPVDGPPAYLGGGWWGGYGVVAVGAGVACLVQRCAEVLRPWLERGASWTGSAERWWRALEMLTAASEES